MCHLPRPVLGKNSGVKNDACHGSIATESLVCTCLEEVASAPSYHRSLLSLVAIYHDNQVNMGILLLCATVTPGALHLIISILRQLERSVSKNRAEKKKNNSWFFCFLLTSKQLL